MARRIIKDRKPPSKRDKVKALVDKWAFIDLIGFHGGTQSFGQIHKDMVDWYEGGQADNKRSLIIMPRGHLKTTVITVLGILHSIYVNPNIRIYVGSANLPLAKAILREVIANLTNDWLQEHVWNSRPHISGRLIPIMDKGLNRRREKSKQEVSYSSFDDYEDDMVEYNEEEKILEASKKVVWRQDAIQVLRPYDLKEPTVTVGCVKSPATGSHFDELYFDDIINFENYKNDLAERLDTWRNDMFAVLDPPYHDEDLYDWLCTTSRSKNYRQRFYELSQVGGNCSVVGTRYFRHDWYKVLIDAHEAEEEDAYRVWYRNIYQNGKDDTDGYIWYERWDKKIENRLRKEMGKKHFYAQYLNEIIVTEDQTLPFDSIQFIHPESIRTKRGTSRVWITRNIDGESVEVEVIPQICIDPAATCNKNSDFTAVCVGGKDKFKNLYVLDFKLLKLTPDKWIREVYALLDKWQLKAINLETIAWMVTLKDTIRNYFKEFYPISIRDYRPSNTSTKKERIEHALEPLMTNHMLYFMTWMKGNNELVDEFNFFPNENVHDDAPDVVTQLFEVTKPTLPLNSRANLNSRRAINTKYGGRR